MLSALGVGADYLQDRLYLPESLLANGSGRKFRAKRSAVSTLCDSILAAVATGRQTGAGAWLNPHALNLAETHLIRVPVIDLCGFDVGVFCPTPRKGSIQVLG